MTQVTCRLTAKNRDQLRNPTLSNRVWASFTFLPRRALASPAMGHVPPRLPTIYFFHHTLKLKSMKANVFRIMRVPQLVKLVIFACVTRYFDVVLCSSSPPNPGDATAVAYTHARVGGLKSGTGKRRTMKNTGVENAGLENAGPNF